MSFQDALQGIQFFSGLTSGFQQKLDEQRQQAEQNQLKILAMLHQQGTHYITPVGQEEINQPPFLDRFLGTGGATTREGLPAFRIGNNYFAARQIPTMSIQDILQNLQGSVAPVESPTSTSPGIPRLPGGASQPVTQTTLPVPGAPLPALTGEQVGTLPGKEGFPGRPVMATEGGGTATHRTITTRIGNQWYQIPSMFGGKEVSEDQARQIMIQNNMVDPETGEKAQGFPSPERAAMAGAGSTVQRPAQGGKQPELPESAPVVASAANLPPDTTEQQFLQDYLRKNLPLAVPAEGLKDTPETRQMLRKLGIEAHAEFQKQRALVHKQVQEALKTQFDPELHEMLRTGRIKTPEQWAAYEKLAEAAPPPRDIVDATTKLKRAQAANKGTIPDEAAAEVYQDLVNKGRSPQIAQKALETAGYVSQQELVKGGARLQQAETFKISAEDRAAQRKLEEEQRAEARRLAAEYRAEQRKREAEERKAALKEKQEQAKLEVANASANEALSQLDKLQKTIFTYTPPKGESLSGDIESIGAGVKQALNIQRKQLTQRMQGRQISTYRDAAIAHVITITKALTGTGRMAYQEVLNVRNSLPDLHGRYGLPDTKPVAEEKMQFIRNLVNAAMKTKAGTHPILNVESDNKGGMTIKDEHGAVMSGETGTAPTPAREGSVPAAPTGDALEEYLATP